jgi:hypothetical protein
MDNTVKPLLGIEIVRKLLEVKRQAQRETIDNYRNNPETQAIVAKLKAVNGKRAAS